MSDRLAQEQQQRKLKAERDMQRFNKLLNGEIKLKWPKFFTRIFSKGDEGVKDISSLPAYKSAHKLNSKFLATAMDRVYEYELSYGILKGQQKLSKLDIQAALLRIDMQIDEVRKMSNDQTLSFQDALCQLEVNKYKHLLSERTEFIARKKVESRFSPEGLREKPNLRQHYMSMAKRKVDEFLEQQQEQGRDKLKMAEFLVGRTQEQEQKFDKYLDSLTRMRELEAINNYNYRNLKEKSPEDALKLLKNHTLKSVYAEVSKAENATKYTVIRTMLARENQKLENELAAAPHQPA